MNFKILFKDEHLIAIQKPSGMSVHPPEDPKILFNPTKTVIHRLSREIGEPVFPIHRLDHATSGVLLLGLEKGSLKPILNQFAERSVSKTYLAIVRGWMNETDCRHQLIDDDKIYECRTLFKPLAQIELPIENQRYKTTRLTLVEVNPQTGRRHQIRRHAKHLSHPIIGDRMYGDLKINRLFETHFGKYKLFLLAHSLRFNHPVTSESLFIRANFNHQWHKVFDLFGICPFVSKNALDAATNVVKKLPDPMQ